MTYQLLLTTLGQQKLAAAASAGAQPVRITEFAVGQGVNVDFSKRLDQQVLVSKRYQGKVESVASTAVTGQYEITCIVPQDQGGWAIREIGLIDSEGSLIWVGQVPEVQKPVASSTAAVDYRIKAVINTDNPNVNLVIDANVVTATHSWVANNFVSNPRFAQFLNLAFPFGYPYWTHSKSNPKPLFDAMFGFETHWRRLEGVGLVAVKDGDAYIGQPMLTLGQVGTTELATTGRPHTYPIHTSYLFERYDPSTVVETVWKVVANKTSINEGDAVQFTVTANNLPDGQILNWSVKEGALNSSSNDIATPEKTDSGTVILTNGQAIINFTTTPDDNTEEPQKHVRLSVGAPANLSINVPINDAGHNETVMHISQSTTNGIDLAEYYKQQNGSYPKSDEVVRFIVDDGVDIVAPNTGTPAMVNGSNWPSGNLPTIENRGRILGRGGDAGRNAEYYGGSSVVDNGELNDPKRWKLPENGSNGGVAVKGSMSIENYGLVAGGGGGGGGGGIIAYNAPSEFSDDGVFEVVGGSGSGGGAPLGNRSPNANTIESFYKYQAQDGTVPYNYKALEQPYQTAFVQPTGGTIDFFSWYAPEHDQIKRQVSLKDENFRAIGATYFLPQYESDGMNYKLIAYEADESVADKTKPSIINSNGSRIWQNHSVMLKQSANGGITLGGNYGYGGLAASGTNLDSELAMSDYFQSLNLATHHGGSGGDVGMAGTDGINLTNSTLNKLIGRFSGNYTKAREILPAKGGLAGYIKEGSVTITNYSNGVTKGR